MSAVHFYLSAYLPALQAVCIGSAGSCDLHFDLLADLPASGGLCADPAVSVLPLSADLFLGKTKISLPVTLHNYYDVVSFLFASHACAEHLSKASQRRRLSLVRAM